MTPGLFRRIPFVTGGGLPASYSTGPMPRFLKIGTSC